MEIDNNYSNETIQFDLGRHPPKETIKMMTFLLEKVIKTNDELQQPNGERRKSASSSTCFHARSIPSISIGAYLTRILKYCPCANECFLALLVYFDRMSKTNSSSSSSGSFHSSGVGLRIDSYNIHRLIISGIMVASKLYSDVFFTNTRYSKVGGLPVHELNMLELEFLSLNNFSLFVSVEELQHYGDQLLAHWIKEHEEGQQQEKEEDSMIREQQKSYATVEDELAPPVRRRARNLSIDKHGDEIDVNSYNNSERLHKKPNCP